MLIEVSQKGCSKKRGKKMLCDTNVTVTEEYKPHHEHAHKIQQIVANDFQSYFKDKYSKMKNYFAIINLYVGSLSEEAFGDEKKPELVI